MEFHPYPKIVRGSSRPGARGFARDPRSGGLWVAQEKIHGANMVVGLRRGLGKTEVFFGRRRGWLSGKESFFGWAILRAPLSFALTRLREELGLESLICYGELYGGHYPHAEVAILPGMKPVQTGVWYSPELRWCLFDALDPMTEDYLDQRELDERCARLGIDRPPTLGRGSFSQLSQLSPEGESLVPQILGLPRIEKNEREGIVLKPSGRVAASHRAIIKKKTAAFDEQRFHEAESWTAPYLSLAALDPWLARLVNPARIASARSKIGEEPELIVNESVLDVLVDLEEIFGERFEARPLEELNQIEARVRELVEAQMNLLK
jgi:Rnl2 family RNA ligase